MWSQLLLALLILFLPSNLAYHFKTSTAIVQGSLVDYLIPKLYLTDLLILGILFLWLISSWTDKRHAQSWPAHWRAARACRTVSGQLPLISFFSVTLIRGLLTPYPFAALWFWLKLVEMVLFIAWLRTHLSSKIYHLISTALPLAVLWQSSLAILQWLKQSNIAGYWFLGEPVFSATTPGIATASFLGLPAVEAGALKVLPYGTTPHPNVLAGFLAVSLASIWILNAPQLLKYISSILGLIALFLTQSLSAWLALFLAIIISNRQFKLLTIALFLLGISLFFTIDTESFSRRLNLNFTAVKIWQNHPLFGVGLNQFIVHLPQYAEVPASTRFLQPAHNIYLLLLSETGLIGLVILAFVLRRLLARQGVSFSRVPLLIILIIGLADHYPLTLQTGQLLIAIALAVSISSPKLPASRPSPGN